MKLKSAANVFVSIIIAIAIGVSGAALQARGQSNQPQPLRINAKLAEITAQLERDIPPMMSEASVPGLSIALVKGVAHRGGGHEAEGVDVVGGDDRGVLVDGGEQPGQRLVREPSRPVDVLAEADDAQLADQGVLGRRRPASMSATSSLMVLVPQSTAATRVTAVVPSDGRRTGRRPEVAERVEHLVAERVHAAALGEGLAGEHVQALHAGRHAAGGDAGDLGDVADRLPVGEVGLVRAARRPRPARGRCSSRSDISFIRPDASRVPISDAARGQVR